MSCSFVRYAANSSSPLASYDAAHRLTYANAAFSALFLGGDEDALGRGLADLGLPPSLAASMHEALAEAWQTGEECAFTWHPCPDWYLDAGQQHFQCRCIPPAPSGNDGDAGGETVVEFREVPDAERLKKALLTERQVRREAERLKERGRELFFKVIDEVPIFVYMQRKDYTVAYANRKTRNLYGDTEGRLCYEVFSGRTSPCVDCPTFRVFETGMPEDWQFTDRQGRTFHVYDYPFEDENGEPLVMELGIDLTDLKRVEHELFQAQKMRAIGVLAGGIAHDLNNNLLPIIFNVDYALGKTEHPGATVQDVAEPLDEALQAAYRAAHLVEQVLHYSRQQNVSRQALHLQPLAQAHVERFQDTLPESITITAQFNASQDWVMANASQMQQLVLNLCSNAVQAMPDGGELHVRMENFLVQGLEQGQSRQGHGPHLKGSSSPPAALPPGEYLLLQVRDTGLGMEPDLLEQIFEPFYTTKKHSGGTGMGLAVVHAIVTSAGGRIEVASAPGQGAAFSVYLPLAAPLPSVSEESPTRAAATSGHLLLVDDDAGALQAMERVLREAGFAITTAACGQDGLDAFACSPQRYDLVLADQSMPDMQGIDMATQMLAAQESVKIIICTGHVEPDLEQRAIDAGITGFCMKPMTPRILLERVREHCS